MVAHLDTLAVGGAVPEDAVPQLSSLEWLLTLPELLIALIPDRGSGRSW